MIRRRNNINLVMQRMIVGFMILFGKFIKAIIKIFFLKVSFDFHIKFSKEVGSVVSNHLIKTSTFNERQI